MEADGTDMNILYTTDDGFCGKVGASIASLYETNQGEDVRVFVIGQDISPQNAGKFQQLAESYGRSISLIPLGNLKEYFPFDFDTLGWRPVILARLVLDRILPEDITKILYLDGDTIVRRSLASLWRTDMKGAAVGACIEPTCSRKRKAAIGLTGMPYYNAGVLLIDLKAWREQDIGGRILAYYEQNGGKLFANDQDAINGSLAGEIFPLSVSYNYHNTYDIYSYRLLPRNCDYPVPSRQEIEKIRRNPHIIHFLGEERPWRKGCTHRFTEEYIGYLDRTPWKGQGLEDGWQLYFTCWRIFNIVMKPFPMLRLSVINELMPLMLRRKHKK